MFKRLTVVLTAMIACLSVHAIDANLIYYFTHIDSRNGLSENSVKAITQDQWGFIWLGTKNGLNRYDGRSLKQYAVDDLATGRGNHNVSALLADAEGHLWVGTDKGVFVYHPENELFTSFDVATPEGEQIRNWIAQVAQDNDGGIWIVSPLEGAFRYDVREETLRRYPTTIDRSDHSYDPQCICVRRDGEVWIGTSGQGIFRVDVKTGAMQQVLADADGTSMAGNNVYTMCDMGEWLLVGEHEHRLLKYNPQTGRLMVVDAPNVHYKIIRTLNVDGDNIYVGTQDGLYIVNEKEHTEQRLHADDMMPNCLSDNMIYTLCRDRDGGLWIGTMQSGVNYMPRQGLHFYSYIPLGRPNSLSNKHIREMQRDQQGNIWIATEEGKINIFRPQLQDFETLNTPLYKGGTNRLALMVDGNQVWSGLFKNGLDIIDATTHQLTHYSPEQLGLHGEGSVYALFKDSRGRVWLGTGGNGVYIKTEGMHFNRVSTIPDIFTQDIAEDRDGNIWISTIGSGLFRHTPQTARTTQFQHKADDPGSISSNDVSSISIDHDGNLWLATDRGGLCTYNIKAQRFRTYGRADGLPDDVTYKVLEDERHRLWFGTNHGLVCMDPAAGHSIVYHNDNGLPGNQYNYKSATIGADGTFLFGGTNGLIAFNPLLADNQKGDRHVLFTNLLVNREEVRPGADDGILKQNIVESSAIWLPYDFASVSFSVSSLNFTGVESDEYEYMLKGVDQHWNLSADGRDISFSRLQPGEYTLRVRPLGHSDNVSELRINVRHPWWSTPLMSVVYVLLAVLLVYAAFRQLHKRQTAKLHEREQRFREEQDRQLLTAKINFFTDITHEIRTPLTLINGSVENISEQNVDNAVVKRNIGAIEKNTHRLLNLINQLLDFRKVDSNSVKLVFTNVPFSELVRSIIGRFEPTINRMNKTISLDITADDIVLQADAEAVTKILSNLLNNARKYSETFIEVVVRVKGNQLEVRTVNDGAKIPAEKAEEIFKPFTQLDNSHTQSGSGLGLPMARSLAELHGGSLTLNTQSDYNEFVLLLPMTQQNVITLAAPTPQFAADAQPLAEPASDEAAATPSESKEQTVLVVEDNDEVRQMIVDHLQTRYRVLVAKNGLQGLNKSRQEHVDLVISDVMMPEMDGLEMCRRLKEDIETSHIPVIMLTAKQTLDNRLEGLRAGADAYIEKPFSFAHLLTQADTLLQNRRRERESFVKRPYLPVQSSGISKTEEQFIGKITDLILKNIHDPEFNVEQLSADMCMSRSSLHRKIKEVSDMTPIDFIRLIRLKKAAELIREKGYRTTEVCEMVGISSPSYFIKLFQKQFGMTPKEFAQKRD